MAAQWWGYKPEEFEQLSGDMQSERVAVYRIRQQIEGVQAFQARKRSKGRG